MDQEKIGQFIAAARKDKGLTQRQLAEQLGISNRTVSKWETGKGFPEVSLMLPLCAALAISVNELLAGESLSQEDYYQKAEEHIMLLMNEKEENRKKRRLAWLTLAVLIVTSLVLGLVLEQYIPEGGLAYWLFGFFLTAFILVELGIMLTLIFETEIYRCLHCHQYFKPSIKDTMLASLSAIRKGKLRLMYTTPWTRTLRCPHCHTFDRCQRVLTTQEEEEKA